jgi:tight adherence protein B
MPNLALLAAIAGLLVGAAIWLLIAGLRPAPVTARPTKRSPLAAGARVLTLGGLLGAVGNRRTLVASTFAGMGIGALTGWYVLALVLPAVVVGVPPLVRATPGSLAITRLDDLDAWIRSLSGILVGGASGLEQALRASLPSAPATIRPSLARLVARLDAQQPIKPVLRLWADDMDDHTADLVAAALILESDRRGGGATRALEELAESVSDQTRVRSQIETDRSSSRATARWVTIITLGVIAAMVLTGKMIEPYKTPTGQLGVVVLTGLYAGCLLWMRKIATGKPIPRFLPATRTR